MPAMIKPQLEEFMRRMVPKSVAIIPAAREAIRSNDTHYRFRQDSDFLYLTGFEEPEAIAVMKPSETNPYALFVRLARMQRFRLRSLKVSSPRF
jgi:Xaa-Pro aminopeptidase